MREGWAPVAFAPRKPAAPEAAPSNGQTVGLVSLGCPKNLVDSEVMLGQLRARGYEIASDAKAADVIVVNTCAFIDRAKQESIDTILEMAREKQSGRAQAAGRDRLPGAALRRRAAPRDPRDRRDAGHGPGRGHRARGDGREHDHRRGSACRGWVYDHTAPRMLSTPSYMAYVKISEGCDYTCSFCIIPTLRGKHRSRQLDDIVAEVRSLGARGVHEVVLVAQDSTRYGLDLGMRDGLAALLRRLGRIDGIRWIRIMYAYPATMTDAILDAIASEDKVVKYIDIPLQHASRVGAEADEAADGQGQPARARREDARAGAGRRDAHLVHRRLPGRDRGGVRGADRLREGGRVRQRRRVHLLGRGGHDLLRPRRPRPGADQASAPQQADVAPEEDRGAQEPRPRRPALRGAGRGAASRLRAAPEGPPGVPGPRDRRSGDDQRRRARAPGRFRHLRDHRGPPLRPRGRVV